MIWADIYLVNNMKKLKKNVGNPKYLPNNCQFLTKTVLFASFLAVMSSNVRFSDD